MFKFFPSTKKKRITECVVLHSFKINRSKTRELFDFIIAYFKSSCNIEFEFAGFYGESYDDKYGTLENISDKLQNFNWNEIVNFSLDVSDLRKRERTIGVEFEITRPTNLILYFPGDLFFQLDDFIKNCNSLFPIDYGYCYKTAEEYWITSYAIGDFSHSNGIVGMGSLKKSDFERWRRDCEKITTGFLRDIYNRNILSKTHLERQVNGKQLKSYILGGAVGYLTSITDDLSLWILNDMQLDMVRKEIRNSGILI